jgi:hypothetical protein
MQHLYGYVTGKRKAERTAATLAAAAVGADAAAEGAAEEEEEAEAKERGAAMAAARAAARVAAAARDGGSEVGSFNRTRVLQSSTFKPFLRCFVSAATAATTLLPRLGLQLKLYSERL